MTRKEATYVVVLKKTIIMRYLISNTKQLKKVSIQYFF